MPQLIRQVLLYCLIHAITVKPVFKGHSDARTPCYQGTLSQNRVLSAPCWWCPYMTGVPIWQVSLHDRCPYMTDVVSSLFPDGKASHYSKTGLQGTLRQGDIFSEPCPIFPMLRNLWRRDTCHVGILLSDAEVSLEDRFYWSDGSKLLTSRKIAITVGTPVYCEKAQATFYINLC